MVLSGMLGGIETDRGIVSQWGGAIDRFFVGIDLLDAGKAPLIIFTRAQWPWLNLPPEGEILAKRALTMGVNPSQILLTGTVTTTAEEADEIKTLMEFAGMERVILVTSAYTCHVQRCCLTGPGSNPSPTQPTSSHRGSPRLDELRAQCRRAVQNLRWYSGIHRSVLLPDQVLCQRLIK